MSGINIQYSLCMDSFDDLKHILNQSSFPDSGEYEELVYGRVLFRAFGSVYTADERRNGRPPVFYRVSDDAQPILLDCWDIYYVEDPVIVPPICRRPVMFHEIVEIAVYRELRFNKHIDTQQAHAFARQLDSATQKGLHPLTQQAHARARQLDIPYAYEISTEAGIAYQQFVNKWEEIGRSRGALS